MRVLVSIGCNAYDHTSELTGAELDAQRMFDSLLRPEIGQYDVGRSRLLLSPTLDQVRQCLRGALFADPKPETFTFFFAGHGGVNTGSFHMWVSDSSPSAQSMTALSLAELFRFLNEVSPRQSNIIIDACESGGLIADLGVLLKPELLGDAGTPVLTLVATSAQNQTAEETRDGGVGTSAILDCIEGRDFVQDNNSFLDLVEIGQRVSTRLQVSKQSPVVWGLNLYGPPAFCRNPRYASDPAAPLRDVVQNWSGSSDESIKQNYDALWAIYSATSGVWNQNKFSEIINAVLLPSVADSKVLGGLAERLAATFFPKGALSEDPFRVAQVAACFAAGLLPYVGDEPVATSTFRLLKRSGIELLKANASLITNLSTNKYALLSDRGSSLSDLYYLPIRVAKVLGWAAAAVLICEDDPHDFTEAKQQFSALLKLVVEHYSESVVAISDEQAPFWAVTLSCAASIGLLEEGEQLAGLVFYSLIQCKGKLARWDLRPEKALDYLLARRSGDFSNCSELIERPLGTLTVLLKASKLFNLEEVFDQSLWKIDGLHFAAYLPSDYQQFSVPVMKGGQNAVWSIGQDIFRIAELALSWPPAMQRPQNWLIAQVAVVSSLLYPNRVPWFLLEGERAANAVVHR
jgi:Caspase domain